MTNAFDPDRMHTPGREAILAKAVAKARGEILVSTKKMRFVHRQIPGKQTVCGALPNYYSATDLVKLTDDEAAKMHRCKKCFPDVQTPTLTDLEAQVNARWPSEKNRFGWTLGRTVGDDGMPQWFWFAGDAFNEQRGKHHWAYAGHAATIEEAFQQMLAIPPSSSESEHPFDN